MSAASKVRHIGATVVKAESEVYYLYALVFPNGKLYFGISYDPENRWDGHKKAARNGSKLVVYNAIRKYGADNVFMTIGAQGKPEEMCAAETEHIARFKTMDHRYGYNTTPGGELSPMRCERTRRKMAETITGRPGHTLSEKCRAILIECNRTRVWSDESREKIRQAGRTPENLSRLSAQASYATSCRKNFTVSEESRKKMSESQKRRAELLPPEAFAHFQGHKHSEESKARASKSVSATNEQPGVLDRRRKGSQAFWNDLVASAAARQAVSKAATARWIAWRAARQGVSA